MSDHSTLLRLIHLCNDERARANQDVIVDTDVFGNTEVNGRTYRDVTRVDVVLQFERYVHAGECAYPMPERRGVCGIRARLLLMSTSHQRLKTPAHGRDGGTA